MGDTKNVKLGVCNVLFDGIDLGFTKGGVEVSVETSTHEVTVDQFGETPIDEIITGRKVAANVPLAETTLDNLVAIMPGSELVSDGAKATASVTFSSSAPVNNDSVTIAGTAFTFKTAPSLPNELAIPATIGAAAIALAEAVNAAGIAYTATANAGVVTLTAKIRGVDTSVNSKVAATPANITVTNFAGGAAVTAAKVVVSTGVNQSLLSLAKTLVLRPVGTSGADDFIILKAACPGALTFSYQQNAERIYQANFKGYAQNNGQLFVVGDKNAV